MNDPELEEIKLTIQKLSDRIDNLEKVNAANKQYFEYLTDLAISKLTVIPDFALYRENVSKEIESKFSSLEYRLINDQAKVIRNHLAKLPTDLIEDRKLLFKILNETTKMLKDLSYGISDLSDNFSVKLGEMGVQTHLGSEEFDMSRRVSQEQFANMERMLLEYSKGYEGIYAICWQLSAKVDELNRQVAELIRENAEDSSDLGDK